MAVSPTYLFHFLAHAENPALEIFSSRQKGWIDVCVRRDMPSMTSNAPGSMEFGSQMRALWEVVMLPRGTGTHTNSSFVILSSKAFIIPSLF